jgi:hypothetical protein
MDRRTKTLAAAFLGVLACSSRASAQPAITWQPASPANYTAQGGRSITRIVIHKAEGSAYSTWNWFQNPAAQASAHYVVDTGGSVTQMVADGDIAWHAGNWAYNQSAIGIEQAGYTYRNDVSDAQLRGLAALTAWLCDRYGIPKDRAHINGHDEVPDPYNPRQFGGAGHHTDPGPYFDWATFMSYVGGSAPPPPPPPPAPTPQGSFSGLAATTTVNIRDGAWGNILGQAWSGLAFVATGNTDSGFSEVWFRGGTAWLWTGYLADHPGDGAQVSTGTLNVRWDTRVDPSTLVGQVYQGQVYVSLMDSGDWRLIQYDTRREWVYAAYAPAVSLN